MERIINTILKDYGISKIQMQAGLNKKAKEARMVLCYIVRCTQSDMNDIAHLIHSPVSFCYYLSSQCVKTACDNKNFRIRLNKIRGELSLPPFQNKVKPCIGFRYTKEEELRIEYAIYSSICFMERYERIRGSFV